MWNNTWSVLHENQIFPRLYVAYNEIFAKLFLGENERLRHVRICPLWFLQFLYFGPRSSGSFSVRTFCKVIIYISRISGVKCKDIAYVLLLELENIKNCSKERDRQLYVFAAIEERYFIAIVCCVTVHSHSSICKSVELRYCGWFCESASSSNGKYRIYLPALYRIVQNYFAFLLKRHSFTYFPVQFAFLLK